MKTEERIKVLDQIQGLRNHVEKLEITTEDSNDPGVEEYLSLIWGDIQSLIDYLL